MPRRILAKHYPETLRTVKRGGKTYIIKKGPTGKKVAFRGDTILNSDYYVYADETIIGVDGDVVKVYVREYKKTIFQEFLSLFKRD